MTVKQKTERWLRLALARLLSLFLRKPSSDKLSLPKNATLVLLRFDPRVGNAVISSALISTLRQAYPESRIIFMGPPIAKELYCNSSKNNKAEGAAIDAYIPFNKKKWFGRAIFLALSTLRAEKADAIIDSSNPTDPSVSHALLCLISGAKFRLGSSASSHHALFTHISPPQGRHEIELRLSTLAPLLSNNKKQESAPMPMPMPALLTNKQKSSNYAIVNLGARLKEKALKAEDYAWIALKCEQILGKKIILTWGPSEYALAKQVLSLCDGKSASDKIDGNKTETALTQLVPAIQLAPATKIPQLLSLMHHAIFVISCDTGPMHLAVSANTPTFGIFVDTPKQRYGYSLAPHACADYRQLQNKKRSIEFENELMQWIKNSLAQP